MSLKGLNETAAGYSRHREGTDRRGTLRCTAFGTESVRRPNCATCVFTTLRHTHASLALRQGVSIPVIARLLGHRYPQTTLKYTHLADAMVHEAAETVGVVLEG